MNFPIDSLSLSFGLSKLGQILVPVTIYILLKEFLFTPPVFIPLLRYCNPKTEEEQLHHLAGTWERRVARAAGFFSWKLGCDLGFFLVVTQYGSWARAFTWAGLIPYMLIQYAVYHLWGQNLILGKLAGWLGKPDPRYFFKPGLNRFRYFFSKFFYEDMNVTSIQVSPAHVILKLGVDYSSLVASWSIYTIGILFIQSGEINWSPLFQFPFLPMLAFYLGGYLAYIFGFNLFESIYRVLLYWSEHRRKGLPPAPTAIPSTSFWQTLYLRFLILRPWRRKYGLTAHWLISSLGGILLVVLLTIPTANLIIATGNTLAGIWFDNFSTVDRVQLLQVISPDIASGIPYQARTLPNAQPRLQEDFPRLWQRLNHYSTAN